MSVKFYGGKTTAAVGINRERVSGERVVTATMMWWKLLSEDNRKVTGDT